MSAGGGERDVELLPAGGQIAAAIDDACRRKYGRYMDYAEPMVSPQARATTQRLLARAAAVH